VVFGAGNGLGLPLAADAVIGALAPRRQGMGNALSRTVQRVGIALGTAVLGSVLDASYRDGAPVTVRSSIAAARSAGGSLLHAASAAYTHGMAVAAVVCAGVLVVFAAACAAFLPARTAEQAERHDQRAEQRA
jgi:MFS transporter, DHA2 family, multidrug resistance protein